ncbi:hypothetical protein J7J55_00660 [Candidatus Bipolaricaulota bacterium]|nr:hypothetical protein [Candidatus Bipolaricaulota bacterium]
MLKLGYFLMIIAGSLLGGYIAYQVIRLIVLAPGIGIFFKVVILIGIAGLVLILIGLIRERRKEEKDAAGDD